MLHTLEALQNTFVPMHPVGFARRFPDLVRVDDAGKRWYPCAAQLPHEHQLIVESYGGDWYVCAYHQRGEQLDRLVLATTREPSKGRAMRLETAIAVAARLLAELGAADDTVRVAHPIVQHIWSGQNALGLLGGQAAA